MITIHRFQAGAMPVNAYVIESDDGLVAIDATLTVSDGRGLRSRVDALGKPLAGVLVTHTHPDHYGGLSELVRGQESIPIYATTGVGNTIRRDDPTKETILRPMFGDEWPQKRTFPDRAVSDSEAVDLAGMRFRVTDLGPGESPHDSLWSLEGQDHPFVFCGDLVYNHMHAYLADGYYDQWLANLDRARAEFPIDTVLYMGHGAPGGVELIDWQKTYIRTFLDVVRGTLDSDEEAATNEVTRVMKEHLPTDDLLFLMQLSVPPMRAALTTS